MSDKKQFKISVITLLVGILIPILAALIPYGMKYAIPEHRLDYTLSGPLSVKGTKIISLKIKNGGEKLEKNVRVSLHLNYAYSISVDSKKKTEELVKVDTQVPFTLEREKDWIVIALGDIRAKDSLDLSVLSDYIDVTLYSYAGPSGITIKSEENVAQLDTPSEFLAFMYPFGFWMFVLLMVLIFIAGIYQQHFMDPKKREELILKEIDKLKK
jgi:hypothetical protein